MHSENNTHEKICNNIIAITIVVCWMKVTYPQLQFQQNTAIKAHTNLDPEYLRTQLMVWNVKSSKFYRVDECVS